MGHHADRFEHVARWLLLVTATGLLCAVVESIVLGTVSYSPAAVTATAFSTIARLARLPPRDIADAGRSRRRHRRR
jgi:hypothetical protein